MSVINFIVSLFKPGESSKWAVLSLLILWVSTTFSIALMEVATVAALVFWAAYRMGLGREQRAGEGGSFCPKGLWGPLALFFVFVLLSFCFSEYLKQSFRGVFKVAKPLLVFFATADLFRSCASQKRFGTVFLIAFLLVMADSSVQYAFGKSVLRGFPAQDSSAGLRIVGPFGDFGKMSAYLLLVIPVFLLRFWSEFSAAESRKRSFYALALAIAGFILLYLTRCRGPVVALVGAFAALLVYKRWFKALGIGIALFLSLLAVTPRSMVIHLDADGKEQSLVERVELWRRAFDVINAKPWFGTGINTYSVAHEKYDRTQNWRVRGYYAHNGYLQLAAEIGIPGIIFFLLFLVLFFVRGLRCARSARGSPDEFEQLGILTGLLAFLLYALADTNLQSPQSLMSFWFMAGYFLARQNPSRVTRSA